MTENDDTQVRVYQGMVEEQGLYRPLKHVANPLPRGWSPPKRGPVQGLSDRSRMRAILLLKSVRLDLVGNPLGVHLTYPDVFPRDWRVVKRQLQAFIRRARRRNLFGEYFWRLEEQKRGAPHFHLAVWSPTKSFPNPREIEIELRSLWISSIPGCLRRTDPRKKLVKVTLGRVPERLFRYVSQRESLGDTALGGRRWAPSKMLPVDPIACLDLSIRERRQLRDWLRESLKSDSKSGRRYAEEIDKGGPIHAFMIANAVLDFIAEMESRRSSPKSYLDVIAPNDEFQGE